jgi:hypothetical protein
MAWQGDTQQLRFSMTLDSWRAVVQQGRSRKTWRAAIAPRHGGLGRLAPAVFTSRIAAQAWCIGVIRQQQNGAAQQ